MLLLVSERPELRDLPARALLRAGIFSYCASNETAWFLYREKSIGGVLLNGIPDLAASEALCAKLRQDAPDIPIALIARQDDLPKADADRLFRDAPAETLTDDIICFCRECCGWAPSLSVFSLFMGEEPAACRLFGYPFPLPFRESVILRCIFYHAPRTVAVDDLMTLCFPEGTQRVGNLTTQISRINRRAESLGIKPLIVSEYGRGYRLNKSVYA